MTKQERKAALEYFGGLWDHGFMTDEEVQSELDSAVHDLKSVEASEINNQGVKAQLAYLTGKEQSK